MTIDTGMLRDRQKIAFDNANPYDSYWDSVQNINIVN